MSARFVLTHDGKPWLHFTDQHGGFWSTCALDFLRRGHTRPCDLCGAAISGRYRRGCNSPGGELLVCSAHVELHDARDAREEG